MGVSNPLTPPWYATADYNKASISTLSIHLFHFFF